MSLLTQELAKFLNNLEKKDPAKVKQLNPGLSIAEIQEIAKRKKIQLPQELQELYQWRHGCGSGCQDEDSDLFDVWGFYPLQKVCEQARSSPYGYEFHSPYHALEIFFCCESCFRGRVVSDRQGKTCWVEFCEVTDGYWDRIFYYTSLAHMVAATNRFDSIETNYFKYHFSKNDLRDISKAKQVSKIWLEFNPIQLDCPKTKKTLNTSSSHIFELAYQAVHLNSPVADFILVELVKSVSLNNQNNTVIDITQDVLRKYQPEAPYSIFCDLLIEKYFQFNETERDISKLKLEAKEKEFYLFDDPKYNLGCFEELQKFRVREKIKQITIFVLLLLQAVEGLASLLGKSDPDLRRQAVLALGEIQDKQVFQPLLMALRDSHYDVRRNAREALSKAIAQFSELETLVPF